MTLFEHIIITVQVLEWSGSVLDALSLAMKAALHNTLIPKLSVSGEGEEMEIEISDNPHDSTPVDASNTPIIITLTQVHSSSVRYTGKAFSCTFYSKVGTKFVVDATLEEESCSSSRLSLAVNRSGQLVGVKKDGPGGIPYGKMNDIISVS